MLVMLCACSSAPPAPNEGDQSLFNSEPVSQIGLTMRDIRYEPQRIEVSRNALLAIDIENFGELPHDFSIDKLAGSMTGTLLVR